MTLISFVLAEVYIAYVPPRATYIHALVLVPSPHAIFAAWLPIFVAFVNACDLHKDSNSRRVTQLSN